MKPAGAQNSGLQHLGTGTYRTIILGVEKILISVNWTHNINFVDKSPSIWLEPVQYLGRYRTHYLHSRLVHLVGSYGTGYRTRTYAFL